MNVMNSELVSKNATEAIHQEFVSKMKTCLDRYEGFCRLEGGNDSKLFKLLKRELMDVVYDGEKYVFDILKNLGVVDFCMCRSDVRGGYNSNCSSCHGSGYVFTEDFKKWTE